MSHDKQTMYIVYFREIEMCSADSTKIDFIFNNQSSIEWMIETNFILSICKLIVKNEIVSTFHQFDRSIFAILLGAVDVLGHLF